MSRLGAVLAVAAERLRQAGSESARLDSELLLGHVLGAQRTQLLAHPERVVCASEIDAFDALVERRTRGEPVAYIRGLKEFHGLAFSVDDRVLIPRPETEALVDLAIKRLLARLEASSPPPGGPIVVADVGTGSGAIVISVAAALRSSGVGADVRLIASDSSADALSLAVENAVAHGVADRISWFRANLLETPMADERPFHLIVANLPYVPTAKLPELPAGAQFEPRLALDGGPDGTGLIRRLLEQLPIVAGADSEALLEIGSDQAPLVQRAVSELPPGWESHVLPDLSGQPRVLHVLSGRP